MMTSVTLPSNAGPIHSSGYSNSAVADESIPARSEHDFEAPRPIKRCLQSTAPISSDPCKKRRKQSTPVRISAADSSPTAPEGKLLDPSPEPELRCPVCQLLCTDQEHLENHVTLEHMTVDCKKEPEKPATPQPTDRPETPLELTSARPTPDLPWMADMQNKEWMNASLLPFSPANQMFMALPPFSQPETMPPRQQIRIFNPDAYCELCNKEFCNKYFLKTHKANKHGIYSDPPASEQLPTSVNIPSYTSNMKLPGALANVDVTAIKNIKTSKLGIFAGEPPVPEPLGTSSSIPSYAAMPNVDISGIKTEPKPPTSMMGPFPDLFQFQSKLYPKLNKPNIPGLYEQDSGDIPTSSANSSNGLSNGEHDRIANDEQTDETSSSPRAGQCDPNTLKGESSLDQDNMFYASPSKLSPGQTSRELDLSNRYRKIGVMNPKAFCEICCKEYCNKYFLRTHKMKRHGIYIPEDSKDKDLKMEGMMGMSWSQNAQTSPLNLIMTEQNNSSSSFSDRKTSSPPEISCEQCGIKFQNSSLAQLHNVSVHSKLPPISHEPTDANAEEKKSDTPAAPEKIVSAADTISEDLQKLQTLVLQLNDLDVNKAITTCSSCNKEFENRFYLHAHMMTEHGLLLDEGGDNDKNGEGETTINNNTMCEICGKDLQSVEEMKKHMVEFHSNKGPVAEIKEEYNNFTPPEKGVPRTPVPSNPMTDRRASMSLTPTSSYCEICNKELCNKYFMKTHMQRMHGIEIENGAQIGGVVCDICNKELCSKYFLRVHKHNTHGIVEYGTSLLQPRKGEDTTPHLPAEPDPALKPADLADLSHRYFTHFTEVCSICSRRFRSTKWLKAHLLSDHGQAGAEKWAELEQQLQQTMSHQKSAPIGNSKTSHSERVSPTLKIPNGGQEHPPKVRIQNVLSSIFGTDDANTKSYHCSYCPFSTTVLPFLFVHERSHSLQSQSNDGEGATIKCPVCPQTFVQAEMFQHHMFSQHPFLPIPPFFNGSMEAPGELSKEPSESAEEAEEGLSAEASKQIQSVPSSINNNNNKVTTKKAAKRKLVCAELSPEVGQSLKDVAKKTQLPATYALPQGGGEEVGAGGSMLGGAGGGGGYVMQAFLVDETIADERRFAPSVVFLPVLQRQSGPCSVTFNLTPA